jgi:hypothetical protein
LAATDYGQGLRTLAKADYRALALGRWDSFSGSCFSEWNFAIRTCDPFPIPDTWPMWRGGDDGFARHAGIGWLAHDEIHDRVYVTNELYARGMTPATMAQATLAIDRHGTSQNSRAQSPNSRQMLRSSKTPSRRKSGSSRSRLKRSPPPCEKSASESS